MKIISLNTWGGRAGKEKLLDFLTRHADADVFCLQEIWADAYDDMEGVSAGGVFLKNAEIMVHGLQEISAALPAHEPYFAPHHRENYGLLMLMRKSLAVRETGELFVHKHKGFVPEGDAGLHARNIQYAVIDAPSGPVTLINFHGLWAGKGVGKGDTPDRLLQSENIASFLRSRDERIILVGDFNLLPDTESLRILERAGLENLITKTGVTSTRTSFYGKPEKYADYALVSPSVPVKEFRVLPDEVSDHAPLYLETA